LLEYLDFDFRLDPISSRRSNQWLLLGFLGIETIPSRIGEIEAEQYFRLSPSEIATGKTRRGSGMQLGFGLHVGFLRMSGRVLNSTDFIHCN
jgi:hypothetical protein